MTARLYKREVEITLSRSVGFFAHDPANQIIISDMRVQFSIVKNLHSDPNTCELTITNLAPETRAALQVLPLHVRIAAGYDGETQELFAGDMFWSGSRREGVDWLTKIQVGDGTRARANARISRTFKSGVDPRTVISDVAKSMGLVIPKNLTEARDFAGSLLSGVTTDGPSHEQMTKLLAPKGYGWSVQGGKLQALKDGETLGGEAIVIGQDTGMVGAPDYGAPEKDKKPPVLTVKTLLKPELRCGGRIAIESLAIRGLFRVNKLTHEGDTAGPAWHSTIEGVAV